MPAERHTKSERVQVRVDARGKRTLARAAALANSSVSAFVINSALDAADRLIRERERIVLSDRDWDAFFDAIAKPPQPNAALRKAFAARRRLIVEPERG